MRLLLVLCSLISFSSHAKLQNLTVVDGNFSYDKPYGTGDVQKIQLGISKNNLAGPYAIEIFREENIDLASKTQNLAQEYSGIIGAQLIHYNGQDLTGPQAAKFLRDPDRNVRKAVYDLLFERKNKDNEAL